jgi:hypothetical protein
MKQQRTRTKGDDGSQDRKRSYSELLRDPRWQKKRLEVLSRDNFTCQHCDETTKTLHVHHCYYERGRKPWEYDAPSLVTLCCDCHEYETATYGMLTPDQFAHPLLRQLLDLGLTVGELEELAFNLNTWGHNASVPTRRIKKILSAAMEGK